MEIIKRGKMPDGTIILLEDWTKEFPKLKEHIIAAYPIAKNNSKYGWIIAGEKFRLQINYHIYNKGTNEEYLQDFQDLMDGKKELKDFKNKNRVHKQEQFYAGWIDRE